jgi:hypothetical protein
MAVIQRMGMATVIQRLMATAIPHMDGVGRIGAGPGVGDIGTGVGDIGTGVGVRDIGTGLDLVIGTSMPQPMVPDFTAGGRLPRRKSDEEKP